MSFLAPLFLTGLAAVAIPILVLYELSILVASFLARRAEPAGAEAGQASASP